MQLGTCSQVCGASVCFGLGSEDILLCIRFLQALRVKSIQTWCIQSFELGFIIVVLVLGTWTTREVIPA